MRCAPSTRIVMEAAGIKPAPGGFGEGVPAPDRSRAVFVEVPAASPAPCPMPSCVASAPARGCCSNVARHVTAALEALEGGDPARAATVLTLLLSVQPNPTSRQGLHGAPWEADSSVCPGEVWLGRGGWRSAGGVPASAAGRDGAARGGGGGPGHAAGRGERGGARPAALCGAGVARYLECGVLAHGFARVRCESCKDELLVAFSCKGQGVSLL